MAWPLPPEDCYACPKSLTQQRVQDSELAGSAPESPWLDLIAGARYLDLDTVVVLSLQSLGPGQSVTLSESVSVWDGIVGVKGRLALGERWFLPYYFDIGAGDSDFTWQASAGVSFQAAQWADIALVYRHLDWEFESDSLINDFNVSGPALGALFRF